MVLEAMTACWGYHSVELDVIVILSYASRWKKLQHGGRS